MLYNRLVFLFFPFLNACRLGPPTVFVSYSRILYFFSCAISSSLFSQMVWFPFLIKCFNYNFTRLVGIKSSFLSPFCSSLSALCFIGFLAFLVKYSPSGTVTHKWELDRAVAFDTNLPFLPKFAILIIM